MAALPIAILFEGEYPQFAAKLPGLSPSHAAYVKSTARKEAEWKATEGHTTILVPVSLADLDAYLAAGRARNPTALTVLALEKANRLLPLKAADCTLVRVTMHAGWERPTTTIWIAAINDPKLAAEAVRKHSQPDWELEAMGPPDGDISRFRLAPGEACPYPPS